MAKKTRGGDPDPTPSPEFPPAFVRAVNAAIRRMGWRVQSWQSDGVECLDEGGEKASFGLDNLYRRVKDLERAEWADAIAEHLRRVSAALREKPSETDLNEVADRLLLRVGKPFGAGLPGPHPWSHALEGTDLVVNVVIDYPETMAYVTAEMIGRSGKPGGHWLEVALDNLRQMTTPDQLDLIDEETGILL